MGITSKLKEEIADIKSAIDDLPDSHYKWGADPSTQREIHIDWSVVYRIGALITGSLAFIASWVYAAISWGFLLGVGLGWVPAIFIGIIAGFIWPLIVLALVLIIGVIAFSLYKP
jgi:hypothetical protein